jgi:hypothetical protein
VVYRECNERIAVDHYQARLWRDDHNLNGQTKAIYSDGAGSGAAMVDAFQDLSVPDLFVDDDLTFTSDSAVITFGADGDTTLTHTDGSGLTLNSTNKIMFNDASQFIQGSSLRRSCRWVRRMRLI